MAIYHSCSSFLNKLFMVPWEKVKIFHTIDDVLSTLPSLLTKVLDIHKCQIQ